MKTKLPRWIWAAAVAALLLVGLLLFATTSHDTEEHGHEHSENEEHGEGGSHSEGTVISAEAAQKMGIETAIAGPATIHETIRLSGRVVLDQNRSAAVKARFPGIVRGVFKQVGDAVKRGEKIATIESNESLQTYAVPAPLDGVVLERSISVGDTAGDAPIFTVADLNSLWAEFFVFAGDMDEIRAKQPLIIRTLNGKITAQSAIDTIQPMAEMSSQTVVARATLDNTQGEWRAGMTVQGDAVTSAAQVAVAVPTAAIQRMEGEDVVFVKEGERYEAVIVALGIADADNTQITGGLEAGAEVVSKNSFVVKADIGKSDAGHEH